MATFAADLSAARAAIVTDPVEAIMQAVAEHSGLEWPGSDPEDSWGERSAWSYHPSAEYFAGCLLYWFTPLTQKQVANRLGYAAPGCKVPSARRPPDLHAYCYSEDEDDGYPLEDIFNRAEEILRNPLVVDGVAVYRVGA
jgi:hypothetical protein